MLVTPRIHSIYPGLLLIRIALNFSMKGPLTAPLTADYIEVDSRGKATAIQGLGAGCGAVFSVFVLFGLTKNYDYKVSFTAAAVVYFLFAIYMLLTIQDVKHEYSETHLLSDFCSFKRIKETLSSLWRISKNSKAMNLSYYGSFVARMGDVVYIVFLNLWISSFYSDKDTSSDLDPAKAKAQMISGIGGVLMLLLSFFVGYASDKLSFDKSITFVYGIRALASMLVYFSPNSYSALAFTSLLVGYVFNGF